ncbi:ribose-phosphate pyrophosphokinase [Salipiger aestuarii]|uniref:Ribose 1,5-bisphosphate phosphokinase PhnN n=1 Tax=Salipiger aestuarii TaxID=568098 RepID=A0A327YSZ9_9RHOB|nr:phosphonate metabolism protein/1,5-bisphosphokinase (PRPP-forming) PhnN [Salipiger aestuarii]EIE49238.1 phosphonate metabolism, 1,5-bisphosphokinase (PRPP-forming) PhnN [Citreicella sp. 357]KAA8609758.1 ribose-phosphate pyrophosphokinase [Salipiger aestuarii]KAA8614089.1 ribose-phosphate pyrophosphokinase [Salipiger aestuarii]KAB2543616.1 ribose-phosphate pyrophosphokinase [Salipiger aestuarii]RAK22845.1 ribose 1,5-bisphosphokinase [Salipiger aestuarii]
MSGQLFAVVGPSGVGKDTLMAQACARLPGLVCVRRVITRDAAAGGEAFDSVSERVFADMAARGDFALHWRAHGLRYGIPVAGLGPLARGERLLCNLSRGVLREAAATFPALMVLHVTARADVLGARLAARGRESTDEIAHRLARTAALPDGLNVVYIDNSGPLEDGVAAMVRALQSVSA